MPKKPARGPKRACGSKIKIRCAYAKCARKVDCKNKPFTSNIDSVDPALLRGVRGHCKVVRFCSKDHRNICLRKDPVERGGREALGPEQIVHLFNTIRSRSPWAAVMLLLSLMMGERADAVRNARDNWFRGLSSETGELPTVCIPRVNRKTKCRTIPLNVSFAQLLYGWMVDKPLQGSDGKHWPHPGQTLKAKKNKAPGNLLFPGRQVGGTNRRAWQKPVTERAYFDAFVEAQRTLQEERLNAYKEKRSHVFDDVDLSRVTTHSCKKSTVTLLKDAQVRTSIISAITGTTGRVLDDVYDCPSRKRQRQAMHHAFGPVVDGLAEAQNQNQPAAALVHCVGCGTKQGSQAWKFCPSCGQRYLSM